MMVSRNGLPKPRLALVLGVVLLAVAASAGDAAERSRGNPAARLAKGGSATEYWDVTATFASGHFLCARFLITNEGPGDQTGVGMGRLVGPNGEVKEFQYGREASRWSVSPDGLTIRVASSILDLHGPRRRLTIDSGKRAIKIAVEFAADGETVWSEEPKGWEHRLEIVQMPTLATASIWVGGMSAALDTTGTVAVTHAFMDRNEASLLVRRLEIFARQGDRALYVADMTRPDGRRWQWMAFSRAGAVLARREDFAVAAEDAPGLRGEAGYPLPRSIRFEGAGLAGSVRVERELLRTNPLAIVPQPFRFLLSFRSAPRQVWAEAHVAVGLDRPAEEGDALALDGAGVLAVHYLNPTK
jgi:hypothetical protein